jgi:hypothetical protein
VPERDVMVTTRRLLPSLISILLLVSCGCLFQRNSDEHGSVANLATTDSGKKDATQSASDDKADGASDNDPAIFELRPNERFFRANGQQGFVLGRNPIGTSPAAFDDHFKNAAAAGERLMRIHLTHMPDGEKAGEIHPDTIKFLDHLFESAEKNGLAVLPVLGVWADWNDGRNNETWHAWHRNPFNFENGGPAKQPSELLDDTACRELWFQRINFFIDRWGKHRNIVAWELFSELNLITDATEQRVMEFVEAAARKAKAADPLSRPITVSLSEKDEWPSLARSEAVEFLQVHPYGGGRFRGGLDMQIIRMVRERLQRYGKPVLLGECGLDWRPPRGTLDVAPRAKFGIRHAVWASIVSGAMCGRMLWWQDGYDQFERADLLQHYQEIAVTAAAFVEGVDYSGFQPIMCSRSRNITGAMLGSETAVLGWFRDSECAAPKWPVKPVEKATVSLRVSHPTWSVQFVDPITGHDIETRRVAASGEQLQLVLPKFEGSIAFKLVALPATSE